MKLAGRPLRGAGTLALLALLVLPQAAAGAEAPKQDTLVVQAGAFYQETILLPPDGSPWTGSVRVVNGSQAIDLYIVRTVDTLGTYPSGAFVPLEGSENTTSSALTFSPSNRFDSYTVLIDNLDNSRSKDAQPAGPVEVEFRRSPPLQASSQAQALLGGGLQICAVLLGVLAVGLALFLRRRRKTHPSRAFEIGVPPSVEVPVEVPAPQRGAWAKAGETEAQGPEPPPTTEAAP
ncbi:MAG TPA: hypothetical protein VJ547_12680 [Candidatus Thermoplasmatota archaeon]|nr:hypothetical protein [Candidatus Thermoplasmatota archaeon]